MHGALARRVQRYGWDRAAADYEPSWRDQLAVAQAQLVARATLRCGERVLDVASGTGLVAFAAARAVGARGHVDGVDLSGEMVAAAVQRAGQLRVDNATFSRMDAEALEFPDAQFDAVLCGLGLMYVPDAARAIAEMRRVLRPGGRAALMVWGERASCGFSPLFEIVDAEVRSDVCPLFFRLGEPGVLAQTCTAAGFATVVETRLDAPLVYADAEAACRAAFIGGPVALAWSRFDPEVRARVRERYVQAIAPFRSGEGYRLPGEFVVVTAQSMLHEGRG
jgi:ubiquinone/menaquinone biosynthesis C-methylase UbiE